MGVTLTDVLLFGKAQSDDIDNATLVIYRRNILRWSALGGYLDVIVKGVSPLSLPDAVADSLQYVKAFGGTELRNVPEGYEELEYIESTGTQRINIGIRGDIDITLVAQATSSTGSSALLISSTGSGAGGTWFGEAGTSGKWGFGGSGNSTVDVTTKATLESTFSNLGASGTINGQSISRAVVGTTQEDWTLFRTSDDGYPFVGRVFSCIIKQNGSVVRNLIPAKRNSDNVVGMYDTVSGAFLTNQGTGTFIAGPKVPVIPAEYTPVEFVTNVQQTSINTGITIDFSKTYEMEIECRAVTGSWYLLQSREDTNTNITGIGGSMNGNTINLSVNGYTVATSNIARITGKRVYVKVTFGEGAGTLYVKNITDNVDDTQTGTYFYGQTNPPAPIHILGNAAGQMVDIGSDIYMVRIKENGVTVLNCVPVRRREVAGLYDAENDTFLTAVTPSALTAAREISRGPIPTPDAPIDIWCNNGVLKTAIFNQLLVNGNFETTSGISSTGCTFSVADNTCLLLANTESGRVWLSQPITSGHKYLYTCDIRTTAPSSKIQLRIAGAPVTTSVFTTNWQTLSYLYNASSSNASLGVADTRTSDWDTVYIKNAMVFDLTQMFGAGNEPATTADAFAMIAKVYGQKLDYYPYNAGTPKNYAVGTVETVNVHGTNIFNKLTDDTHEGYFVNGSVINNLATSNRTIVINCKPNTKYSFWHTDGVGGCRAFDLPTDTISVGDSATWLTPTSPTYKSANQVTTITTHSNAKKLYICAGRQEADVTRSFDDQLADFMLVEGEISTATEYVPYFNGGSATCEDLLSVSNYTDEQELIAGNVIRKVGVKVLTGTEDWSRTDARAALTMSDAKLGEENLIPICTHYYCMDSTIQISSMPDNSCKINANTNMLLVKDSTHNTDLTAWKQWLTDQYAAGTPVIIVYPLATPTTESVTGQTLQVADGDNTLEITQASLNNLELEAKYQAAVSLTIQEVQDANLDPNVEVTIN